MKDSNEKLNADEKVTYNSVGEDGPSSERLARFDDFESALSAAGGYGRYQILLIVIVQWSTIQFTGNFIILPLATCIPEVHCGQTTNGTTYLHAPVVAGSTNYESHGTMNEATLQPLIHNLLCSKLAEGECETIIWSEPYFHSIIREWGLICTFDYVPELINSIQTAGNFIALILVGMLSDKMGRKNVCCACFGLLIVVSPFSITAANWYWFAVTRCLVGALSTAASVVMFVWSMESIDIDHSMIMNIAHMKHLGYIITALIGYTTRAWRAYLVVVNIIGLPIIVLLFVLVESPRWLIQQDKLEQAAHALTRMAHINEKKILFTADSLKDISQPGRKHEAHLNETNSKSNLKDTSNIKVSSLEGDPKAPSKWDVLRLFSDSHLAGCTLLIVFLNISISYVTNAFLFQVSRFHEDPTLKFLAFGVLRGISAPLVFSADKFIPGWGRREMVYVPFAFTCLCFGITTASKLELLTDSKTSDSVEFAAMLTAAVLCNFLWAGTGQYTVELFPVAMRNTAAGFTSLFDPLAAICIQQLVYLESYYPAILVLVVLANSLMATGVAYALLPETKGRALPDC